MARIYILVFLNGKAYIGVTRGTVAHRVAQHANKAKNGAESALYRAWRKYGAPSVATLEECLEAVAYTREIELIAQYSTQAPGGYNIVEGGKNPKRMQSSTRRVVRKVTGRKLSESHRHALSIAHLGIPNANKGRKRSPEDRAKMRAGWKKKFAAGWRVSPETREKIAAARRGKTLSPEAREKVRQARIAYWRAKRDTSKH